VTTPKARSPREKFSSRRPLAFALGVAALVLALTADERVFGLVTDGQIMTRTAYAMAALGEIGIALGHPVDILRPAGDAVTRYGMGPSFARVPVAAVAGSFENAFGLGASQTLFVLEQILFVLLAALAAGLLARACGSPATGVRQAVLATALASPLWAYVSSDWSEPLQAACVGGAFACAALAGRPDARRPGLLAAGAGALAGFALLTKSVFVVLLPLVLAVVFLEAPRGKRRARALAFLAGAAPLAALWLAFEIVRFGRPFASYAGEPFSHDPLDGLWRLTVGPNKGLFLYFPLALLGVWGLARLAKERRVLGLALAGFAAFLLVTTSAWWSWDGASGWGPRLLMPLVPLLAAAAVVAPPRPVAAFAVLFGLGIAVNALGVLQPDGPTTWYYMVLPQKALTEAETRAYAPYAVLRATGDVPRLGQWFDIANHAELSPIKVSAWLLARRLSGGDVLAALKAPPWRTDRPGFEMAVPPEQAIPSSALVFLTSPFRWPHLGMSLVRGADQKDTVLAWIDCLYDQALRAQDMGRGDRAIRFGEELYRRVPSPQTITALAEGYRIAGRREAFRDFLKALPPAERSSPDLGIVLALAARDTGNEALAREILGQVLAVSTRGEYARLAASRMAAWPPTLRKIQYPAEWLARKEP
jgi:tetratricopeptide (TPR) repeat protein